MDRIKIFFETPFMFWQVFVVSFLLFTGVGAAIQCWFMVSFCNIKNKKRYYAIYILISYAGYLLSCIVDFPPSPMLNTLMGAATLFLFLKLLLKQDYTLSAIVATLTIAVTVLSESIIFLIDSLLLSNIKNFESTIVFVDGFVVIVISLLMYNFFIERYSVKSPSKSKYLLAFSLLIFFIAIALRTIDSVRYVSTTQGITLQKSTIQSYEMVIFTVIGFLCICTVLFAYEKTIKQVEGEKDAILLRAQMSAQESYIAESRQKYSTTQAFRHDFNNHILALRGLINRGDMEKAAAYMDRFEQTNQDITFCVNSGNSVADTLLSEKLSYARQLDISVQCDAVIPSSVKINDYDLCAILANAIDNAIKGSHGIVNGEKKIDIVAKPNQKFFIIDIINDYQEETYKKGNSLGLTTIQIIVHKYGGTVGISNSDNVFRLSIILPFDE